MLNPISDILSAAFKNIDLQCCILQLEYFFITINILVTCQVRPRSEIVFPEQRNSCFIKHSNNY